MRKNELTPEVIAERKALANHAKECIKNQMHIDAEDEQSLMTTYRDFYLQISFTELHPLMVICFIRKLEPASATLLHQRANEMNLKGVLGCHTVNDSFSFYHYRTAHWLDAPLTKERFCEILTRCADEAIRGYSYLIA